MQLIAFIPIPPKPPLVLAAAAVVLAFALLPAASADASYTSKFTADAVVMTGNSSFDALALHAGGPVSGRTLRHNRAGDPGFASDEDFDSTVNGIQKVPLPGSLAVLTINAGRGDDTVEFDPAAAALLFGTSVSIDGGDGDDDIRGTDSPDLIRGGFGDDHLAGAFSDRGDTPDTVEGGPGDDVLEWREGDESDLLDGDEGTDLLRVQTGAGGDVLAVSPPPVPQPDDLNIVPLGTRFQVTRSGNDPFELKAKDVEAAQIATGAGDDSVTADPAMSSVALSVDGGAGADALSGSAGNDILAGGEDGDTLSGGAGADLLDGADGSDSIAARDSTPDLVRCGDGTDSAVLDAPGVDAPAGCESVDALPAPATPAAESPPGPSEPGAPAGPAPLPTGPPRVGAGVPRIVVKRGRATASLKGRRTRLPLTLSCAANGPECAGELLLTTARPVKAGRARVMATLGSARYRVAAGATRKLTVALPKGVASLASRRGTIAARVVVQSRSVDGLTAAGTSKLTIALPAEP